MGLEKEGLIVEVVMMPIGALKPFPGNPRLNSEAIRPVAESIRKFGFRQPIVADADGFVIVGHTRLEAAKLLGMTEVPVHVAVDMSAAQAAAYRLADNRTAEIASWDVGLLAEEMRALIGDFGLDMAAFGWSEAELKSMLDVEKDAEVSESEATALAEKWGCELGKLWKIGPHRLLCGDSTKASDVSRLLAGDVPFIMVTDPPYGVEYEPGWRHELGLNDSSRLGKVANDDRVDWTEAYRLFPGDVAYVWHAGRFSSDVEAHLKAAGLPTRAQLIWRKPALIISRGHYHWQHEPCWYSVREGADSEWRGGAQSTVWEIANVAAVETVTEHGTQKPLECMARPIRNHGSEERSVYEPFAGSGTTLVAAHNQSRVAFGMELDPKYCGLIIERMVRAFPDITVEVETVAAEVPPKRKRGKSCKSK